MASTSEQIAPAGRRYWQNWDNGSAARKIDDYWVRSEGVWRERLVDYLAGELGRGAPVLEVGCGSGLIYKELRGRRVVTAASYTGGDASKNMLAMARDRNPGARFTELDIFDLSLAERSQPNVICVHVLQHLPSYEQPVRELMRVAGDKLVVVSWFTTDLENRLQFSEPSADWDGQAFHNNTYSLPRFLAHVVANCPRPIRELKVHHFYGQNYAVSLTFADGVTHGERGAVARVSAKVKNQLLKLVVR